MWSVIFLVLWWSAVKSPFMPCRNHEWFQKDLPLSLFPDDDDATTAIVDVEAVREVCEVKRRPQKKTFFRPFKFFLCIPSWFFFPRFFVCMYRNLAWTKGTCTRRCSAVTPTTSCPSRTTWSWTTNASARRKPPNDSTSRTWSFVHLPVRPQVPHRRHPALRSLPHLWLYAVIQWLLVECSIDWLIDWLILECLFVRLIDWLIDWAVFLHFVEYEIAGCRKAASRANSELSR